MPELPELEVLKEHLESQITNKKIKALQIVKPYILKNYFTGDLATECVEHIDQRGKFLIIELTTHKIVIHLMLHGSVTYVLPSATIKKTAAALLRFDDNTLLEMSERGSKKRMSLYVLMRDQSLEKIDRLGIEPRDRNFTREKLQALLHDESRQVKSFLCDQKKIAGIGNAYADEILWKERISPFKRTNQLTDAEVDQLHRAIRDVLNWAIEQVRKHGISEKRPFLNIHNRAGRLCPQCNETILSVSFSDKSTFYCPGCQTSGRRLKDRRMSKFYR
jgi:formamidopyrimidine-DNA glycosylase